MTDQPYTEDDLRVEAAKQLATLTEDAEFVCIGERMEGSPIASAEDSHWDQLDDDQFDTAQRRIDTLISRAADLSAWAVELGADGLEPSADTASLKVGDRTLVRVHVAFERGLSDALRREFIASLGESIAELF